MTTVFSYVKPPHREFIIYIVALFAKKVNAMMTADHNMSKFYKG